jgi:DNA uptake protein ComE-like DNA-binding protein
MECRNQLNDFKEWNDLLKVIAVDAKKLEGANTRAEFHESGG